MDNDKIKHLEFIQSNIARMNQCSFKMKNWTIVINAALLAVFAASIRNDFDGNHFFLLIGIFPTILFWFLDAYYLQQERKFRGVYDDVAGITTIFEIKPFAMPLGKYHIKLKKTVNGSKKEKTIRPYWYWNVFFSVPELPFYFSIIMALIIGSAVFQCDVKETGIGNG
ncbi:MAG: hypothetical protein ACRCUS_06770 [Anaerovoracaceae bacterium]